MIVATILAWTPFLDPVPIWSDRVWPFMILPLAAAVMLSEMLGALGHEVVVAVNGPQALEAVKTFHPDVAVLDIGLPLMDGYELAYALRTALGTGLRLFALTGYGQTGDRERSAAAGFEHHFVKPIAVPHLLAAIDVATS